MIYLLRHGLDDESYIGGYSDVSLTEEGKRQVEKAKKILDRSCKFDRIISSDIKRAVETTNIINEGRNIPVEYASVLRELNKGDLNGMLKEKAKIAYSDYMEVKDINLKYPNGESMIEFYERIKKNIDRIMEFDNALLVTHRGVINMLYYILNNIPLDMDKEKFGVTHASIHELDPKLKVIRKVEF